MGGRVEPLIAELVDPPGVEAVADRAAELDVELLVNNAGFGTYGAFAELPLERELDLIRLNVAAVVELTHRLLPALVRRRRGGVINVASEMAFQPMPYFASYAREQGIRAQLLGGARRGAQGKRCPRNRRRSRLRSHRVRRHRWESAGSAPASSPHSGTGRRRGPPRKRPRAGRQDRGRVLHRALLDRAGSATTVDAPVAREPDEAGYRRTSQPHSSRRLSMRSSTRTLARAAARHRRPDSGT